MDNANNLKIIKKVDESCRIVRNGYFNKPDLLTNNFSGNDILCYIENEKYIQNLIDNHKCSSVIGTKSIEKTLNDSFHGGIIISDNPRATFFKVHNYLTRMNNKEKIKTTIGKNNDISKDAAISEYDVEIGENCIIESGVSIKSGTKIGSAVHIHSGVSIGEDAFYYYENEGRNLKVESPGGIIIEDNVEIMGNCTIAKSVFLENTIIGENSKIDCLVHIAHDVIIEDNVLIAAGTTLGGAINIKNDVFMGLASVVTPMTVIGENAFLCANSVVTRDVTANSKISGNFAIDHEKHIRNIKKIR